MLNVLFACPNKIEGSTSAIHSDISKSPSFRSAPPFDVAPVEEPCRLELGTPVAVLTPLDDDPLGTISSLPPLSPPTPFADALGYGRLSRKSSSKTSNSVRTPSHLEDGQSFTTRSGDRLPVDEVAAFVVLGLWCCAEEPPEWLVCECSLMGNSLSTVELTSLGTELLAPFPMLPTFK